MIKPILFNTEMVRAILDGNKTVTRRIVKPRYRDDESGFQVITNAHAGEFIRVEKVDENECGIFADGTERTVSPPFDICDILWVRETWCDRWLPDGYLKGADRYGYKADSNPTFGYWGKSNETQSDCFEKWRPSIHMPKQAARIFLRVTGVRAERLQDISEEQIAKEGVVVGLQHQNYFMDLWNSTIKKQDIDRYGWDANPWVWVIEFERCEKPEGF